MADTHDLLPVSRLANERGQIERTWLSLRTVKVDRAANRRRRAV